MNVNTKYSLLKGSNVLKGVDKFIEVVKEGVNLADPNLCGVELFDLHKKLSISKVNAVRLASFKHLNANPGLYDSVLDLVAGERLREILGPDLLVQTKLNLSIQLPGDEGSQLDLHSDCWSGDTPFQVNLWIPLTPCFASNSMFLLSEGKSLDCIRLISKDMTLDRNFLSSFVSEEDFLFLEKGEVIIFNPGLVHGNVPNKTDQTRVSINVRFKNLFSPDASDEHISRSAGLYYRKFHFSKWTKLAMRLRKVNSEWNAVCAKGGK
jgi:sporadic carbohydrate cluster 2OG-Fe(II) oxygenase